MNRFIFCFIIILNALAVTAQLELSGEYPEVGKVCPDFTMHNISFYKRKEASLNDFSGKWLVLDFWNRGCGACVASFPKTSNLQKQFANKVQFMMVGIQDKENKIVPMYNRFREKESLVMPCAFDSLLAQRFDIYTAPYIIIMDERGVVRAITGSIDSASLQELITGRQPRLMKAYRVHEDIVDDVTPFDGSKPFLVNGNGDKDTSFLFRSVLSAWSPYVNTGFFPVNIYNPRQKGVFQVLGVTLSMLYNYAFFGVYNPDSKGKYGDYSDRPSLEIRDSSYFISSYKDGKNCFSYSLIMPSNLATPEKMQSSMQNDLEKYFGYSADVEERTLPCLNLVASDDAKARLATKGGQEIYEEVIPKANFKARNWPISALLAFIRGATDDYVFDETGIVGNIDIDMDCLQTDFNDIVRALNKNGLTLVPGQKKMKLVVIKDGMKH